MGFILSLNQLPVSRLKTIFIISYSLFNKNLLQKWCLFFFFSLSYRSRHSTNARWTKEWVTDQQMRDRGEILVWTSSEAPRAHYQVSFSTGLYQVCFEGRPFSEPGAQWLASQAGHEPSGSSCLCLPWLASQTCTARPSFPCGCCGPSLMFSSLWIREMDAAHWAILFRPYFKRSWCQ